MEAGMDSLSAAHLRWLQPLRMDMDAFCVKGSRYLCIYACMYNMYLSVIYLSVYLSTYLSIYLSDRGYLVFLC